MLRMYILHGVWGRVLLHPHQVSRDGKAALKRKHMGYYITYCLLSKHLFAA